MTSTSRPTTLSARHGAWGRNPSLIVKLSVALSAVIAVVALAHTASGFVLAVSQVHQLLDRRLQEVASRVSEELPVAPVTPYIYRNAPDGVVVQVWLHDDEQLRPGAEQPVRLPRETPDGFSTQLVDEERWRVYAVTGPDWAIHVSQRDTSRKRIAMDAAIASAAPALVMIPLAWLAIVVTVRRMFRRVGELGERAAQLDLARLDTLPTDKVPREILPLVTSINAMIERLSQSVQAEKMFIADAAHELRSPLTALQIQADNLGRTLAEPQSLREFQALRQDIARTARLVAQLLRLARADAPLDGNQQRPVPIAEVVADVIEAHLPCAAAQGIDLGVDRLEPLQVEANAADLRTALSNLVDNAIKYAGHGAVIDVRVYASGRTACIDVRDTGPGVDPAALPRVFDRFFRADGNASEGNGLGLAIVRALVQKHGGEAFLANREDTAHGTIAGIRLPLWSAAQTGPRSPAGPGAPS
ncbi:HAMP domain-containing sensor histidine kinase [Cupriavidus sp. AU9028]|uniref:sensor histidine kinase n=1 Tax=Cupriavidus sp. AU9028 TaxID=2871157 RepID=UPI001C97162F|nr:HAMP domain-containing sensor histidine kinase [Cupriavidus sp. AU9028]MBY4897865.1 HAMP domain-containing histidine kinase [Cupriavidus sp. AU9028]